MVTLETSPRRIIEELEADFGFSAEMLAQTLGVSQRTLSRWRSGDAYPQHDARQKLTQLIALDQRLHENFDAADAVREWMHTPSRYLAGLTPAEAARAGRVDRVDAALDALESGFFV